jgi:hypothetical protein
MFQILPTFFNHKRGVGFVTEKRSDDLQRDTVLDFDAFAAREVLAANAAALTKSVI